MINFDASVGKYINSLHYAFSRELPSWFSWYDYLESSIHHFLSRECSIPLVLHCKD